MSEQQSWDAHLYDTSHGFVAQYGEDVLSLLRPQAGERVLDLGCGTGHLTRKIAEAGCEVVGLDASAEMIAQAQSAYPELAFVVGDGATFRFDTPFDAIFSNAALHWMLRPADVAGCIYRSLKPDGRFVAEMGGATNIAQVLDGLFGALRAHDLPAPDGPLWYFPTTGEYATLLEAQGFRVVYAHHFDRPTALAGDEGMANWFTMFLPKVMESIPEDVRADVIRDAENRLRPRLYRDGVWYADYVRLRVIAIKAG
jgi:trans-aconitate methyltransferase